MDDEIWLMGNRLWVLAGQFVWVKELLLVVIGMKLIIWHLSYENSLSCVCFPFPIRVVFEDMVKPVTSFNATMCTQWLGTNLGVSSYE